MKNNLEKNYQKTLQTLNVLKEVYNDSPEKYLFMYQEFIEYEEELYSKYRNNLLEYKEKINYFKNELKSKLEIEKDPNFRDIISTQITLLEVRFT